MRSRPYHHLRGNEYRRGNAFDAAGRIQHGRGDLVDLILVGRGLLAGVGGVGGDCGCIRVCAAVRGHADRPAVVGRRDIALFLGGVRSAGCLALGVELLLGTVDGFGVNLYRDAHHGLAGTEHFLQHSLRLLR